MKRKLWTALLLTVLTTVLLSTAAAADGWGTGGWNVPKRQTDWNPDGVWMEGEYYSVDLACDTKNVQASDDENRNMADNLNYMIAMSWDEEFLYTYISYEEPNGYVVTPDLWDGNVIQFSGTDVGQYGGAPRLEIGLAKDFFGNVTDQDAKLSINWSDWLESGYGYGTSYNPETDERVFDVTCADDFEVFYCDSTVTYEFRVPFSAFSEITPAAGEEVGVAYVISTGNGEGAYAHTQIGRGITGGKAAELHSPITLTDVPDISVQFPEEVYQYGILFHNIGMTNVRSNFDNIYLDEANGYQNLEEGTAFAEDLLGILTADPLQLKTLTGVEGHHSRPKSSTPTCVPAPR